jgi:hypothetical protein
LQNKCPKDLFENLIQVNAKKVDCQKLESTIEKYSRKPWFVWSKVIFLHRIKPEYTGVAQLAEHWSPKPGVGSSSLSSRAFFIQESWPSGRRRTPGKCVNPKRVSRVRIPHSPLKTPSFTGVFFF